MEHYIYKHELFMFETVIRSRFHISFVFQLQPPFLPPFFFGFVLLLSLLAGLSYMLKVAGNAPNLFCAICYFINVNIIYLGLILSIHHAHTHTAIEPAANESYLTLVTITRTMHKQVPRLR